MNRRRRGLRARRDSDRRRRHALPDVEHARRGGRVRADRRSPLDGAPGIRHWIGLAGLIAVRLAHLRAALRRRALGTDRRARLKGWRVRTGPGVVSAGVAHSLPPGRATAHPGGHAGAAPERRAEHVAGRAGECPRGGGGTMRATCAPCSGRPVTRRMRPDGRPVRAAADAASRALRAHQASKWLATRGSKHISKHVAEHAGAGSPARRYPSVFRMPRHVQAYVATAIR